MKDFNVLNALVAESKNLHFYTVCTVSLKQEQRGIA